MSLTYFKNIYINRNKTKELLQSKRTAFSDNREEEEMLNKNYERDICSLNHIIKNIMMRHVGDPLFMLLSLTAISEYLYDNNELIKIFLYCAFVTKENILNFIFYDEELDEKIKIYLDFTEFRIKPELIKIKEWNYHYLFQAFDTLVIERPNIEKIGLSEKDYKFIKYLIGLDSSKGNNDEKHSNFNPSHSETWKSHFKMSKILLNDLLSFNKYERVISILEAFLFFDPIQKHILEENYDQLQLLFKKINIENSENGEKIKQFIVNTLKHWIQHPNSSSILRDGLRKLLENF
jgi:hypothetical protein